VSDIDLRDPSYHDAVAVAAGRLGVTPTTSEYRYGWHGKSLGVATDEGSWLRLSARPVNMINERLWTGEETASVLSGVARPSLLRSYRWVTAGTVWRADEMELVTEALISDHPEATEPVLLPESWWDDLAVSLDRVSQAKTVRVNTRQDLINRRITAYTNGAVDPTVNQWAPAHGDLHWANLTAPRLSILDWEGWGTAPLGIDAATLWAFSMAVPGLAAEVEKRFSTVLATRDGKLSQLFMCIELIRMTQNHGDHPALLEPLVAGAERIIAVLKH
jgi:hypothetical protein